MVTPILLEFGSLEIRYYGLLFALAFLIGYFIIKKLHKQFKISEKDTEDFFLWALIGTVVGARLFEVLFYDPKYYLSDPIKIFYVWEGGLASHGAIISLVILAYIFCKRRNIKFNQLTDLFVIPISLGAGFVRLGNFINGELVGKITSVPWAVKFNNYPDL